MIYLFYFKLLGELTVIQKKTCLDMYEGQFLISDYVKLVIFFFNNIFW